MIAEYVAGATQKSLAVKYGVHEHTVQSHVRRARAIRPARVTDGVLADFAAGVPVAVLADRCGVSPDTIRRHARAAGVDPGPRQLRPNEINAFVALYTQGTRIADIGRQYGIGHRQVRRVLADAGVVIRPRGRQPMLAGRQHEVMELRDQGWSYARIGGRMGVNATTVRDHVIRWGA
ncbi:MAG: helix-turn-helix domain-containing protein [Actinomycetia bacterium]|nr:helix-turn-helix domain-containing protein [Actinomycetes bacterium]